MGQLGKIMGHLPLYLPFFSIPVLAPRLFILARPPSFLPLRLATEGPPAGQRVGVARKADPRPPRRTSPQAVVVAETLSQPPRQLSRIHKGARRGSNS